MISNVILCPLLLAFAGGVLAQDATGGYPTWVTNDYPCVIKCMEDQFKDAQPPASADQTAGALGCVRDACSKDTAEGNIYQAHYIINMFNTIGSIYEPESWQAGNAPDAKDLVAPSGWTQTEVTTTWTEADKPTTVTTSVWVPPETQQNAVETGSAEPAPVGPVVSGTTASDAAATSSINSSGIASNGTNSTDGTNATEDSGAGTKFSPIDSGLSIVLVLGTMVFGGLLGGAGVLAL